MSTRFFTNSDQNTLLNKFKGVFENNTDIEFFDALVGFFRASGYFSIRPFLDNVPHIRILVGINVDKIIERYQRQGLLFQADHEQTINEYLADVRNDIQNAEYRKDIEDGILQFVEDIATGKIEIKAHPTRKLHAKIYIFKPENFNEHKAGAVITGSSNLTDAGLGTYENSNYEFNVLLNTYDDVKFASDEFEKLWIEGVPVLPVEIERAQKKTFLKADPTPFELYIKFLIEYFGKSVEFDPNSITDLPPGFYRLSYQLDAVSQGFNLLQKHNGFFLADVVGLGKTVIATLIAKKFFYSNGFPSHISKILVVVPPALKENWLSTFEKFDLNNFDICTSGSIHKVRNKNQYDLIIVDEAHKFRNDTTGSYNELQILCKTPTKRRLESGKLAEKKVILVSATPLNNKPDDIRNQVLLFQDGKDSTLDISNLTSFFARKELEYRKIKNETDIRIVQEKTAKLYEEIREKVIEPLTVRRTRTDLLEHEMYRKDLDQQGIVFPKVEKPVPVYYKLDTQTEVTYDYTMNMLEGGEKGLQYMRYRAIQYLRGDLRKKYKHADLISRALAKMMKMLLVKRLDSSFYAFKSSLFRFYTASQAMMDMFEKGKIYIAPNLKVTEYIADNREDELEILIAQEAKLDPTITICERKDFEPEFYEKLKKDHAILESLYNQWKAIDHKENDPKIKQFIEQLDNSILDKKTNPEQKLIVFSESKETIEHISDHLKKNNITRFLTVSAANRRELEETISTNFDANIEPSKQRNDFDFLISTEVLAEGINLHRCNVIVNYDTPWNSTRLMQRIGRVNRIGTRADAIHIYNFYPTSQVDDEIRLKNRAIMKLQAFHSALGEDSQIYSPDEIVSSFGLFDSTIEEERDERLAFLMELRKFKEENEKWFRRIKNLPLRSRVGRKDSELDLETTCFIRNDRRDVFYHIRQDNTTEELSFVETANRFKTVADEEAIPLHEKHHEQVRLAVKDFNYIINSEASQRQAVDVSQGPQEKKALAFLEGYSKLDFLSDEERELILVAKKAIKIGKFQNLQRDVNKLNKSVSNKSGFGERVTSTVIVDSLLKIIGKYELDINEEDVISPVIKVKAEQNINPEIIISESFSA